MSGRFYDLFQDERAYLEFLRNEDEFADIDAILEQDPDSQKLIESAAFLNAKLRKKLEAAFPEITQNVLHRTWPTPLHHLPSTIILQFSTDHKTQLIGKNAEVLADDSYVSSYQLHHISTNAKNIYFRTCRALAIKPINIEQVTCQHSPAGSVLSISMSWGKELKPEDLFSGLIFYLGNEPSVAARLKLYLEQCVSKVTVQYKGLDAIYRLCLCEFSCLTADQRSAILPLEIRQFQGLQKALEFFSLPHVDDFMQLSLSNQEIDVDLLFKCGGLTISFHFDQLCSLDNVSKEHLQLNCVPAINLFQRVSETLPLRQARYTLDCPDNLNIHSIVSIDLFIVKEDGEEVRSNKISFKPITEFEKRHHQPEEIIFYYALTLDTDICDNVVYQLAFYDHQGLLLQLDESFQQFYAFQCVYLCTNSQTQLNQLQAGQISGCGNGIPKKTKVTHISAPSRPQPPLLDSQAHWQVINHFSLSAHLLAQNAEIFRMLLNDLNFYRSNRKIDPRIEGIYHIEGKGVDWIFKGVVERGWKLTLILCAEHYENEGEMYQFGKLMVDVFSYYVDKKQFVMADIVNRQAQKIGSILPIWGSRSEI